MHGFGPMTAALWPWLKPGAAHELLYHNAVQAFDSIMLKNHMQWLLRYSTYGCHISPSPIWSVAQSGQTHK